MKRLILALILVVLSASVFASLNLDKQVYGPENLFEGVLLINDTAYLDNIIVATVKNCGEEYSSQVVLHDLLNRSGIYSDSIYEYEKTGSGVSVLQKTFSAGEDATYAFYINNQLSDFSFDLSGSATGVKFDIGADGEYDWQYFGDFTGWGTIVYSEGYDGNSNYNTGYTENPHSGNVCSDSEINFERLQDTLKIKVNAVAKKTSDSNGYMQAKVMGTNKYCTFEGISTDIWTEVSCEISLDLNNEEPPMEKEICLTSPTNLFLVPYDVNNDHFFMSFNPATYDETLNADDLSVPSLKLDVNNYYGGECDSGFCVVPLKIYSKTAGSISFAPSLTYSGGGGTTTIFDIIETVKEYNLTGKILDLSFFSSLKTPSSENENCTLQIDFLSDTHSALFNVSDAPVAKFEISAEYSAKNLPISFDGSISEGNVSSWKWDFGDNTSTATGENVSHTYLEEGNFTVKLTVSNLEGVENSVEKEIHIVTLEKVLEEEVPKKIEELNDSITSFNNLEVGLDKFYVNMGLHTLVASSYSSLINIEKNFTSLRDGNSSDVDLEYKKLFDSFNEIIEKTPKKIIKKNYSLYKNYKPNQLSDIPSFSKTLLLNSDGLNKFRNRVYEYNQGVNSNYNYYLIDVKYLGRSERYAFVSKDFSFGSGELVEKLNIVNSNIIIFSTGCVLEELNKVIYCSSLGSKFEYAYLSDSLDFTSSLIIPSSAYLDLEDEVIYDFDCDSGNCDYSYCGDNMCFSDSLIGVDEGDSTNEYYCPKDCGKNVPWVWYISLGTILLLGILWINFYRGPGNFFDLGNKISYKFFHKKLFLVEKDRVILRTYTVRALKEGFNEGEIRKALLRKGWSQKQLDHIFNQRRK